MKFVVKSPIKFNGNRYEEDAEIEVAEKDVDALPAHCVEAVKGRKAKPDDKGDDKRPEGDGAQ